MQEKLGNSAVILASIPEENKVSVVGVFSDKIYQEKGLNANEYIREIALACDGKGGGKPNFAQGGGKDTSKLEEALTIAKNKLIETLS